MKRSIPVALLPALLLLSCSNGTDSDVDRSPHAKLVLKRLTTVYADSTVVADEARAYFSGPDSTGLYAGTVHLNDVALHAVQDSSIAGIAYSLKSPVDSVPLVFGATQHLDVGGSAKFAAFQDSAISPTELTITAPARTDTVSRSNGFTIAWNLPTEVISTLTIAIVALGDSSEPSFIKDVPDNSRYVVPAAEIANFPTGPLWIFATRQTTTTHTTPDGRKSETVISSTFSYITTLAP